MSKIAKLYGHISFNSKADIPKADIKVRSKHMRILLEMTLKELGIENPHVIIKIEPLEEQEE